MKILKLFLENFQGIRNLSIDFGGLNANIYGDNGVGKTTIYNAVTWLLFDRASTGVKNFSPKTKGADGHDIHYLNHSVACDFILDDGSYLKLSKTLLEDWRKKRGSAVEVFNGNTTKHFVDGVPVTESEYNAKISDIINPDYAKILTVTNYFPEELPWQVRRKILLEVCGDITDDDVISSHDELFPLATILRKSDTGQRYSVEDYLKIAASKKSHINKELDAIPSRIDEAEKAIPDLTGISLEAVNATIDNLEAKRALLEGQKASVTVDSAVTEMRQQLSRLQMELNNAKASYLAIENQRIESEGAELRALRVKHSALSGDLLTLENKLSNIVYKLQNAISRRGALSQQYQAEQVKVLQDGTICAACGQELPIGRIQELQATFERNKDAVLHKIRSEIEQTCSKPIIAELTDENERLSLDIQTLKQTIASVERQIAVEQGKQTLMTPFEHTEDYRQFKVQIDDLAGKISSGANCTNEAQNSISRQISDINLQIEQQAEYKSRFAFAAAQKRRINELIALEESLAAEFERIQHSIYLCETFIKTKVRMLSESINSKFKTVSFRLFIQQINGGIKEDCEVMIPGECGLVPYSTANNAARINAGIEIINVLSKHWGVSMPLFIDNREGIVRIVPTDTQVISLWVSEADKVLRVEREALYELEAVSCL